jgi:hypothetical protein
MPKEKRQERRIGNILTLLEVIGSKHAGAKSDAAPPKHASLGNGWDLWNRRVVKEFFVKKILPISYAAQ